MIFSNIQTLLQVELSGKERKAILLASLGSMLEFYDFISFGFMTVYFRESIFFHRIDGAWAAFTLFAIFVIGYFVRPLGMVLYSRIAPHYANQTIMAGISGLFFLAMLLIAIIPTASGQGFILPLAILSAARLLQSIAGGAEMQAEYDHLLVKLDHKIVFAILGVLAGNELGQFLALLVNKILSANLSSAEMNDFGWRIPFLLGCAFTLALYGIRYCWGDKFSAQQSPRQIIPNYKLFTFYPYQTLIAITLSGLKGGLTFLFLFFIPFGMIYFLKLDFQTIMHHLFIATVFSMVATAILRPFLSFDNAPKIMLICIIIQIPVLAFWAWAFSQQKFIMVSILPIATLASFFTYLAPRVSVGLFPSSLRFPGVTFCYHFGFILFGGIAPLLNIAMAHLAYYWYPNISHGTIFYLCCVSYILIISICSLICLAKAKKYANYQELNEISQHLQRKRKPASLKA